MKIKYNPKFSLFFKIYLAIGILACCYVLFSYPLRGEYLLVFPIILFCIYGWIYITKYTLEITESRIISKGFLVNKAIDFDKVVELGLYNQALSIKSKDSKIKITTDLAKHKDAIILIVESLKSRKNDMKIKGDKAKLLEYFNK